METVYSISAWIRAYLCWRSWKRGRYCNRCHGDEESYAEGSGARAPWCGLAHKRLPFGRLRVQVLGFCRRCLEETLVKADSVLCWHPAAGCQHFAKLSQRSCRKRRGILWSLGLGVTNARTETVNNRSKVAIGQGYGFRNMDNRIEFVMLGCSDLKTVLLGWKAQGPSGVPQETSY